VPAPMTTTSTATAPGTRPGVRWVLPKTKRGRSVMSKAGRSVRALSELTSIALAIRIANHMWM
jgi:hypothetical protein